MFLCSLSTDVLSNTNEKIEFTPATVSPLIRVIIRLWCHEVARTFYDRIIDSADRQWFAATLQATVVANFCREVEDKPTLSNGQEISAKGILSSISNIKVKKKQRHATNEKPNMYLNIFNKSNLHIKNIYSMANFPKFLLKKGCTFQSICSCAVYMYCANGSNEVFALQTLTKDIRV